MGTAIANGHRLNPGAIEACRRKAASDGLFMVGAPTETESDSDEEKTNFCLVIETGYRCKAQEYLKIL